MASHVGDTLNYKALCVEDAGVLDVSSVETKQIEFKKPVSGDILTKDAAFVTNGSDGALSYQFQPDELNESGTWRARPYVEFDDDNVFHGDWKSFDVKP